MNTQRYQVLLKLKECLEAGRPAFLVTVLETWGASPRPAGSILVFDPSANKVYGSVSGGCVEEELLRDLYAGTTFSNAHDAPILTRFGRDLSGVSLPCGAEIELMIEEFSCSESKHETRDITHVKELIGAIDEGREVWRSVHFDSSLVGFETRSGNEKSYSVVNRLADKVKLRYDRPDRLLLIGLSDVSLALLPLAESIGYEVQICDPRHEHVARQTSAQDISVVSNVLPDDLVYASYMDENCAIVALAHDPRIDDLAVYAGLQGQAHFVGAMGSQRNALLRQNRLQVLGLSSDLRQRLHAPVGVQIGSRTPSEIAISIVAQLVQVRSQRVKMPLQVNSVATYA